MGDDRVGVTVPHPMLLLQDRHQFHVLGGKPVPDKLLPFADRASVLLLDRREVRRRSLGGFGRHRGIFRASWPVAASP